MKTVLSSFFSKTKALFHRRRLEREMREEMRLHIEALTEDFVREGMSRSEAALAARRRFGSLAQLEERCRDEHGNAWVGQTLKDLVFSLQSLAKAKLYALAMTLALVLGAATLIVVANFTKWTIGASEGFPDSDKVCLVGAGENRDPGDWLRRHEEFEAYRKQAGGSADFVSVQRIPSRLQGPAGTTMGLSLRLSRDGFAFFGVKPRIGRPLEPGDHQPGAEPVVVISDVTWRLHFGMSPEVLDQRLIINGQSCRVVGVLHMGRAFPMLFAGDYYLPYMDASAQAEEELIIAAKPKAGLQPGTLEKRLEECRPAGLSEALGKAVEARPPRLILLTKSVRYEIHCAILTGGLLLYLIAVLNFLNLGLVRLQARRRELAIRLTLGGSRGQVLRLLAFEAAGPAGIASILLLLFSYRGINLLYFALTQDPNTLNSGHLDSFSVYWLFGGTLLPVGLLLLAGHRHLTRTRLADALKEGGTTGGESRQIKRLRNHLVSAQATLAVILLTGMGLMATSLSRALSTDLGYDTSCRLKVQVAYPPDHPAANQGRRPHLEGLKQALAKHQKIKGISLGQDAMFPGIHRDTTLLTTPGGRTALASGCSADGSLAENLGLRLTEGRWLDEKSAEEETVLSERLARQLYPDGSPLNKTLRWGDDNPRTVRIVGVVRDQKDELHKTPGNRAFRTIAANDTRIDTLIVRLEGPMQPGFDYELMKAVQDYDPLILPAFVSPIEELMQPSLAMEIHLSKFLTGLSVIGFLLSLIAVFASTAHIVETRLPEYGIRLALGTYPRQLCAHIIRHTLQIMVAGVLLGTVSASLLAWLIQDLLYQTSPFEPMVSGCVALLVCTAGMLACLIPALKAARSDPARLLKNG